MDTKPGNQARGVGGGGIVVFQAKALDLNNLKRHKIQCETNGGGSMLFIYAWKREVLK